MGREGEAVDPILLRAKSGDSAAFEALMHRHERLVFGTAWRLLGVLEDAEDATQEVFLRLYHHLSSLDPARPLAAWLYRVTVNVCHSSGRKRRGRPTVPIGEVGNTPAKEMGPAAAAELQQEQQMVAAGLDTLTKKERAALVLHDIQGLATDEVATALQVTEGTVRTHLCRGRLKMRSFRERWHQRKP